MVNVVRGKVAVEAERERRLGVEMGLRKLHVFGVIFSCPFFSKEKITTRVLASHIDNPECFRKQGAYKYEHDAHNPPKFQENQIRFLPFKNKWCYADDDLKMYHEVRFYCRASLMEVHCAYSRRTAEVFSRRTARQVQQRIDHSFKLGVGTLRLYKISWSHDSLINFDHLPSILGSSKVTTETSGRRTFTITEMPRVAQRIDVDFYASGSIIATVMHPVKDDVVESDIMDVVGNIEAVLTLS